MKSRKPNLFVIGAMKSGTTSLHDYLATHPDVFMCEPKEPWYFVEELNWPKGEEWYLNLFRDAGAARIIGESSADYTKQYMFMGVPKRIFDFNPEARLIYIMRDPVERTISHYWHNVRWSAERRDMMTAIRQNPHFSEVSNYPMQIEPYLDLFLEDRILFLTFEELKRAPEATLEKIFEWLGVDSGFVPPNLHRKSNVTPPRVEQVRFFGVLDAVRKSELWDRIHEVFPRPLKKLGSRLSTRRVDRKAQPLDDVVAYLRSFQIQEAARLSRMLGRDFPEWTTLYGIFPSPGGRGSRGGGGRE